MPAGLAGRVTLTIPLATLLDLAGRPGELSGIGPIDPDPARDLARAAARHPRTTWCVTVTDAHGHVIGHGCARPQASGRAPPRATGEAAAGEAGRSGFAFSADDQHGPPDGYGTWNGGPKCRHDHRMKQDPRWQVEQLGNGEVRWTSPSGRQYTNEPTQYPI
jgi:hypothetical protein